MARAMSSGRQEGLSLLGLIVVGIIVVFLAALGIKVTPAVVEYYTVKKIVSAIVESGDARGTVSEIRRAYDRRAAIDDTPSIKGADLDISKSGGEVVIAFSYEKKVPIFGNVSVCFDFASSTQGGGKGKDF